MIAGLVTLSTVSAFAVPTACVNSGVTQTINSIDGPLDPLGCSEVNVSFENITLTGATTGFGFVQSTTSNVAVNGGGTTPAGTGASITFLPTTAGNWDGAFGSQTTTINFLATAHTGGSYTDGSYPNADTPGYYWFFDRFLPTMSGSEGGSAEVYTQYTLCIGATSTAVSSGGCVAENRAVVTLAVGANSSTVTASCGTIGSNLTCNGAGQIDWSNTIHVTQIAVQMIGYSGGALSTGDLNSFTGTFYSFEEAPEPSTFVLLSGALLGLGLYGRRRRKS